ncbi:hypothetical protein L227DRAFT_506900 [Lentinus tigrinus ALCF2SS1-6]|uniref:Wax synthase domain-containing protein n=2 Tax=Lentinus tigrinus TaxID=5365 RepID=A0A5C2S1X8_9APHY|nr:hypothetical protein L227DRAFT_506900 [Lentinus tigrinus ALCF2SS1-6]
MVLPQAALVVLIALSPKLSSPVRFAAALSLIACSLYIMLAYTLSNDTNYGVGTSLLGMVVSGTATHVLLTDPIKDVRYLRDADPSPLAARPLYKRMWFAACFVYNLRCVGTNINVMSRITVPFQGRRQVWYMRQGLRFLLAYMVNDLCETWISMNRHVYPPSLFNPTAHVVPENLKTWKRALGGFAYISRLYATIDMENIILAVVTVALGISSPDDWPDMFGSVSHAYTVRRFWGYTWHHMMQHHFRVWGMFVVRALGIPRRTRLSSFVQLHVAFALSALQHAFGDLMVGWRFFGRSMPFFLLNGLAITIEDQFLAAAKTLGVKQTLATKALGYIWVVSWFGWSLVTSRYVDWLMEADSGVLPNPVSPTKAIVLPIL